MAAEQGGQQGESGADGAPTSLRFLQLKDAFRRMNTVGVDCIDQQGFAQAFAGLPPHLLGPLWDMYQTLVREMQAKAGAEFDAIAAENGLEGQLEELEALCLQRGLSADAQKSGDATSAPAAAEAAARVAAKQAERAQLQQAVDQFAGEQQRLGALVEQRQRKAQDTGDGYQVMADCVKQVYDASARWVAPLGP